MIIGESSRSEVIENIKSALQSGEHNIKVEPNDPELSREESDEIISRYLKNRKSFSFRLKSFLARRIANTVTAMQDIEITGLQNLEKIPSGAIVTSNHFGPFDSTPLRLLAKKSGRRINTVSQDRNLKMSGLIGFIMNYADIIPISSEPHYLKGEFMSVLKECTDKGEFVLIYPEQEMWFNFRKPRTLKRGSYRFAAELGVPVLPCFVEIIDKKKKDTEKFFKVKYRLHILPPIFPDGNLSVRENSIEMCKEDSDLKRETYEKVYGKSLTYDFDNSDIAGLVGEDL